MLHGWLLLPDMHPTRKELWQGSYYLHNRESRIGTEAAQKRADDAKEAYCQVFCGRASAGFCAYDDQGLVAKRYANQPCFAEVKLIFCYSTLSS